MSDGRRLRPLLEPRLAILREAELRDLARHGGRFRLEAKAGVLVLTFMTPMFLICGIITFDSATPGLVELSQRWPYAGILLIAASAGLALLGAELVSRELVITADGIALESLFLNRAISFAEVESISVKVIDAEEPGVDAWPFAAATARKSHSTRTHPVTAPSWACCARAPTPNALARPRTTPTSPKQRGQDPNSRYFCVPASFKGPDPNGIKFSQTIRSEWIVAIDKCKHTELQLLHPRLPSHH